MVNNMREQLVKAGYAQNSRPNMQSNFNKNADKEPQLNQNKRQNDNRYIGFQIAENLLTTQDLDGIKKFISKNPTLFYKV